MQHVQLPERAAGVDTRSGDVVDSPKHTRILRFPSVHAGVAPEEQDIAPVREFWGPWKRAEQDLDYHERNICILGKQVPDFYVLGVQKCATTSIAETFMAAGVNRVHGDLNRKEFHWFDSRMDYSLVGGEGFETARNQWLTWMPGCPGKQGNKRFKRNVMADFTPDYFRIVPKPEGFVVVGEEWKDYENYHMDGPRTMVRMYGIGNVHRLQFVLMLREPLSQMQSAWYHAAAFNFTNACTSCRAPSFRDALDANLKLLQKSPPELTSWVWTTMYARHLDHWLTYFDACQFYIIPFHQLFGEDKDQICEDLTRRLSFAADCRSMGAEAVHSWSHPHPHVKDDAGELRQSFDKVMRDETRRLVSKLTDGHRKGMGLANFKGEVASKSAIRTWLWSSW